MADSSVAITAGSGTNIDTRTESVAGDHRQVVVLGDPSQGPQVANVSTDGSLQVEDTNAELFGSILFELRRILLLLSIAFNVDVQDNDLEHDV